MSRRSHPQSRPVHPDSPLEIARLCAAAALDLKAMDVVILEVAGLSGFADYFIMASGRSTRQVTAVAEHIRRTLKSAGVRALGSEGLRQGGWVLLDYGDVVVHVFHRPVREFYDLESLWGDAGRVPVRPGELAALLPNP